MFVSEKHKRMPVEKIKKSMAKILIFMGSDFINPGQAAPP